MFHASHSFVKFSCKGEQWSTVNQTLQEIATDKETEGKEAKWDSIFHHSGMSSIIQNLEAGNFGEHMENYKHRFLVRKTGVCSVHCLELYIMHQGSLFKSYGARICFKRGDQEDYWGPRIFYFPPKLQKCNLLRRPKELHTLS